MISRPIAFASGMSVPTSIPSQRSAHCADAVRRGSTTISRAPVERPVPAGFAQRAVLADERLTQPAVAHAHPPILVPRKEWRSAREGRPAVRSVRYFPNHLLTLAWFFEIHFCAAMSGFMWSPAMYFATCSWSVFDHFHRFSTE